MARLQDFQTVSPSATNDKLLIVQAAGQGNATIKAVGDAIFGAESASNLPLGSTTPSGSTAKAISDIQTAITDSTDYGGNYYRYIPITNKMVVLHLEGISATTLSLIPKPARKQYFVVLNQSNNPTAIALNTSRAIQIYGSGTTLYGTIVYQSE